MILDNPDKDTVQSLSNLEGNANFETVKEWLLKSLDRIKNELVDPFDNECVDAKRGAGAVLKEILDNSKESQGRLHKMKSK